MTRITTPFGFPSTAREVVDGIDLSGKRIVITGASSGLGEQAAHALASTGAAVTLACRSLDAGREVAAAITAATGNAAIDVRPLDLGDLASVRRFAESWDGPLHVLVNNAGIMATPPTFTPQGWEVQFATNHVGHAALTLGLHGALAAAGGARVVNVSSIGHRRSPVVFDDVHFSSREYDKWAAYGQSKTANVLHAVGVTQRWADDGITANALHPGGIMTKLQRHMDPEEFKIMGWVDDQGNTVWGFKTPEQGAATETFLASSPLVEGIGGRYFEDCNEAEPASRENRRSGVEAYALDPEAAERLWRLTDETLASA
jgi:NAD(P)-dependent dehydrogenase (short-subunit alcohol dehydrogenase family)